MSLTIVRWFFLDGKEKYAYFQQKFYNYQALRSNYGKIIDDHIVGSYEKQNLWKDYDTYLMKYVNKNYKKKIALDFGCGPGRNVK